MGGLAIADQYIHYERSPLSPHKQSSTSLNTLSRSEGSGFFVDDESEFTERSLQRNVSNGSNLSQQQYLKTTNMADFYYRKSKSTEDLSATKWLEPIADDSVHIQNRFTQEKVNWLGHPIVSLDGASPS